MPIINQLASGGSASPLTTKGDLFGFSDVNARIPVGSDTQVLTADSAQALGLKWAAAGGSIPQTREQLHGANVSIANNGRSALTWDTKDSGTTLLDISNPAAPTIVTAGVYSVAVQVSPDASMTAGGTYKIELEFDTAGEDALITASSPSAVAGLLMPLLAVSYAYFVPAGGGLAATVTNLDGVQTLNFVLASAIVQRLS